MIRRLFAVVWLGSLAVAAGAYSVEAQVPPPVVELRYETIDIEGKTRAVRVSDTGTLGRSTGDSSAETLSLWNRRITPYPIGHAVIYCEIADALDAHLEICTSVFTLPKGRLVAVGERHSRYRYWLPVVGGSRRYDDAAGVVRIVRQLPRGLGIHFRLSG